MCFVRVKQIFLLNLRRITLFTLYMGYNMKNPLLLKIAVLMVAVMCGRGVASAQEAYACHTPED